MIMSKLKSLIAPVFAALISAFAVAYAANITVTDIITDGAAPTLSSCGTSPAITGSDTAGVVTVGTPGGTSCVITFTATKRAAPKCVVSWQTDLADMDYTVSTTAITITQTGTSGNKINYICFQ